MYKDGFTPKLFALLKKGIPKAQILKDISAGIIVGIIALPLAIAFAIASGVSPEKGIITAIIAGFIISLLGGSRVQIGGPTGAFIVIVYSIIAKYGINGLIISTFMAGIILIFMGLLKLGSLLKFIPQTLIIGFTSGIALIILTAQVKDFLGLSLVSIPAEFHLKWLAYFTNLSSINGWALIIGLLTLGIVSYSAKFTSKVPGALVAMFCTSALVYFFKLPVDTISTHFGSIIGRLSMPIIPTVDYLTIKLLLLPAFSIALLGALESLLSAVVADSMIGGSHKSNTELIAQGIANIAVSFFGGIPATGAIARTATNIRSGGRTPIAGIIHSITLLAIFLVAMPIIEYIPMPCLAGILILVAWQMSEFKVFIQTCKINSSEAIVLITTFLLTVFTDLTIAIPIGFILAILLFMKRMSESIDITPLTFTKSESETLFSDELGNISEDIMIFELNGPLFFGSVHQFMNININTNEKHKAVVLLMRYVPIIDASGLNRLKAISLDLQKRNIQFIIAGANEKITKKLVDFRVLDRNNIKLNIQEALILADKL